MTKKIRVLFRGWIHVPHSYACVNCSQLIHLHLNYKDKLEIYVEEMEYYRKEWNDVRKLVYKKEFNEVIQNFKVWKGEDVDLVYSITYPYNVSPVIINNKVVPKCVFYTSEFAALDTSYFVTNSQHFASMEDVIKYITTHNIYFTSPSEWSANGLKRVGVSDTKNKIITHGVDTTTFFKDLTKRARIRKFYEVKDNDILLLNIGAMTQNKGIVELLCALNIIVNKMGHNDFKLLLKGTGDLYQSQQFLEVYFSNLKAQGLLSDSDKNNLLRNYIIFTDKTFSYEMLNDIYNASDLYISPYLAEGFGLVPLEALASGLHVMVPQTGSTRNYTKDIEENGGNNFIHYIESSVASLPNGYLQNVINVENIVKALQSFKDARSRMSYKDEVMRQYIVQNYSWHKVSHLLFNYFQDIVKSS
jgi:glycosyltransferase involved in cell wall biosynthesis